ncbi:hypothetical protein MTR67_019467 [Solanum verrucosum]|uniref:RNase H type-1 domain-containing protein n=1 Tax=Solanum verrucosum TaxID=315347 RepID=A0AAF0QLK4_SOLVR|nr:hypothetical protein MTR67_019467 [Solanum verrucosum]
MTKVIEGIWEVPWSVVKEVEAINKMRKNVPIQLKHTLREGNTRADFFANLVVNFAGTYLVENFQELPNEAKIILNMDMSSMPNFRIIQQPNS